ncbi:MAG: hypothetical protein FJ320_08810 [SAR202 cluster bacterium]|nr:hypothetical protein [SAR202 cluster bacterium]
MTIEIRSGTITGALAGGITTNVNVTGVDGHAGPQVHIELTTPVVVTPGNTYVLAASSPNAANNVAWCYDNDLYPNGRLIAGGAPQATLDHGFRTFAPPDPVLTALQNVQAGIDALEGKSDTLLAGQGDISGDIASAQTAILNAISGISIGDDSAAIAALEAKMDAFNTQFDNFDVDVRGALFNLGNSLNAHDMQFDSFDVDVRGELLHHRNALNALEAKLDTIIQMLEDLPFNNGKGGAKK